MFLQSTQHSFCVDNHPRILQVYLFTSYLSPLGTMGKNTKTAKAFIESIPDSKFSGFPSSGGTIYTDRDYRLDMQGVRISAVIRQYYWANLYPFIRRDLALSDCMLIVTSVDQWQPQKVQSSSPNQSRNDNHIVEEVRPKNSGPLSGTGEYVNDTKADQGCIDQGYQYLKSGNFELARCTITDGRCISS
jgi:hypothetical protein